MSDGHRWQVIDHVAIAVRDADEAAATFTRRLGRQLTEGAQLQLVQPVALGAVADFVAEHGEGLHHICCRTHDIEAALRAAGEQPTGLIFTGGRGQPCAFLTGTPHGVRVELTEAELP